MRVRACAGEQERRESGGSWRWRWGSGRRRRDSGPTPGTTFILGAAPAARALASSLCNPPPHAPPSWQDDARMQPRCTSQDRARRLVQSRTGAGWARPGTQPARASGLCLSLVPGDHESMDQRGVAQSGCPPVSFHWQHGASVARADGPEGGSLLSSDLGRGHPPHVVACHWLILPWFRYTPRG